jgi:predicted transcriptional regulator
MFDDTGHNGQLLLTRVFQALSNINTRKIVELLAQGPRSCPELLQIMDSTDIRIKEAMKILGTIGLVSEHPAPDGVVYVLNSAGLDLARSWLGRVESIRDYQSAK